MIDEANAIVGDMAPFADAMAYSGMQINGAMDVAQETNGAAVSIAGTVKYIADGWLLSTIGPQVMNGMATYVTNTSQLFRALHAIPITANASPAGGDLCVLLHRIEGVRIARLAWGTAIRSSHHHKFLVIFGTPRLVFRLSSSTVRTTRSYTCCQFYGQRRFSMRQYKTVTIPGDITGTWATDTTTGMTVHFSLLVTSPFATAPRERWTAGYFLRDCGDR